MSHWRHYHRRWAQLQPPLRPDTDVVYGIRSLTGDPTGPVLLLGVTPELARAFAHVRAVDKSRAMIANLWPGDSPTKRAVQGDWLDIVEPAGHFTAVIGDGSLNAVSYPCQLRTLLIRVRDLLADDGRFVCRVYERPAKPFKARDLLRAASGCAKVNFHAFKWQIAMHIAEQVGASVPVTLILGRFNDMFPDRDALSERTGWSRAAIDTIDVYRGSSTVLAFPNREELVAALPKGISDARFHECGSYDLASRCPILTFRKS